MPGLIWDTPVLKWLFFYSFCLLILISISCRKKAYYNREVSIHFYPYSRFPISKYHFKAVYNHQILIDTLLPRVIVSEYNGYLKKLLIDTTQKNILTVQIQHKTVTLDLNTYKGKCIEIYFDYDNHSSLYNLAHTYEMQVVRHPIDFHRSIDSLRTINATDKFDSVAVEVNQQRQLCHSVKYPAMGWQQ
jgi:hypothetical protein